MPLLTNSCSETVLKVLTVRWRAGSEAKSTNCSCKGYWFSSQHPMKAHNLLQLKFQKIQRLFLMPKSLLCMSMVAMHTLRHKHTKSPHWHSLRVQPNSMYHTNEISLLKHKVNWLCTCSLPQCLSTIYFHSKECLVSKAWAHMCTPTT